MLIVLLDPQMLLDSYALLQFWNHDQPCFSPIVYNKVVLQGGSTLFLFHCTTNCNTTVVHIKYKLNIPVFVYLKVNSSHAQVLWRRSSPICTNCPSLILFISLFGTGGRPAPIITGETSSWRSGVMLGKSQWAGGVEVDGGAGSIRPESLKAECRGNIPAAKQSRVIHRLISWSKEQVSKTQTHYKRGHRMERITKIQGDYQKLLEASCIAARLVN